jgi:pimeloyl-ACP methyl ester carboxylesterase
MHKLAWVVVITLLQFTLQQTMSLSWQTCPALTDISHDPVKVDYAAAEQHLNMEQDSLRPKSNDTEFTRNLKRLLVRNRFPTYGISENQAAGTNDAPGDMVSECMTTNVNYYNDESRGHTYGTIKYFAKRYRAKAGARKGAIYLLQGGPGAGGEALEPMGMKLWTQMKGEFDIVIPDHRGTARSTLLTCTPSNTAAATVARCQTNIASYTYSKNLDGFTADEAALDTINLMKSIKKLEGGLVYLYGVSYGTYLSHRIIQWDPDTVDAVILDGVCGGKYCDFTHADLAFDVTGRDLLDRCAKDSFCQGKMGTTQQQVINEVKSFYTLSNECTKLFLNVGENALKAVFTSLMMDPVARLLIPAITYRAKRCSVSDQIGIVFMINNLATWQSSLNGRKTYQVSNSINYNIGISELGGRYGDYYELKSFASKCTICNGASAVYPGLSDAGWVKYPESKFAKTWAKYNKPLLMLNGDLDPQTYWQGAQNFSVDIKNTIPNSRIIRFKDVVHYVLGQSPLADNLDANCGFDIAVQFFQNPNNLNSLDTKCTDKLLGLPFGGYSVTYDHVSTDLYDGFGFNKAQYIIYIFSWIGITLGILICCGCCGICCCWTNSCGPFKPKQVNIERVPLTATVFTVQEQPINAPIQQYYQSV